MQLAAHEASYLKLGFSQIDVRIPCVSWLAFIIPIATKVDNRLSRYIRLRAFGGQPISHAVINRFPSYMSFERGQTTSYQVELDISQIARSDNQPPTTGSSRNIG